MLVNNLKLVNYRNYNNVSINFDPSLNIIVGKNGVGKTNILEAILVVSNTKSFRTPNDCDLIQQGKDYSKIELTSNNNIYKVVINKDNKSLYLNDNLIKRTSEFIGKINAIIFKPRDLEIFNDSPKERRKLLDIEIGKTSPTYLNAILKYNYLLKDKNKLLKEQVIDETLLEVINNQMVKEMFTIIQTRDLFFGTINKYLNYYYNQISNTTNEIEIVYKKCSDVSLLEENIKKSIEKDKLYRYATFGIHHDDYYFTYDSKEITSIASQGQMRMTLIAFKLALINYIEERINETPIILLDDVLSELDEENKQRLLHVLPSNAQVIITNTDINRIKINKEYKLIRLKGE